MPRPRGSRNWVGKLGGFVSSFTVERLADELGIDVSTAGRYARGDYGIPVSKAIAISEIARSAGTNLTLEDLYATDILRVRRRMHSSFPLTPH